MSQCRILYFRGGILEATEELTSVDIVSAAKAASSKHPHLSAEIWIDDRKVAVVRPYWNHRLRQSSSDAEAEPSRESEPPRS